MKKRIVILMLAGVLGVSIAACGNKETNDTPKTIATTELQAEEDTTAKTERATVLDESKTATTEEVTKEIARPTERDYSELWFDFPMTIEIQGHTYTFGESTYQEMLDDGVITDEQDGDYVMSYQESIGIHINDENAAAGTMLGFWNPNRSSEVEETINDCVLSFISYHPEDYEDTYDVAYFTFPTNITKDELVAYCEENDLVVKDYLYDYIQVIISPEPVIDDYQRYNSQYQLTFNETTGVLETLRLQYLVQQFGD